MPGPGRRAVSAREKCGTSAKASRPHRKSQVQLNYNEVTKALSGIKEDSWKLMPSLVDQACSEDGVYTKRNLQLHTNRLRTILDSKEFQETEVAGWTEKARDMTRATAVQQRASEFARHWMERLVVAMMLYLQERHAEDMMETFMFFFHPVREFFPEREKLFCKLFPPDEDPQNKRSPWGSRRRGSEAS